MSKTTKRMLALCLLCVLCLVFIAACEKQGEVTPGETTLERIEIAKQPNKTEYTVGEKFSRSGMVVKAYYSNGTSKNVMGYTVSKTDALTVDDKEIVITYQEKTAVVKITVTEKQVETQINVSNSDTYTYKVEAENLPFSSDEIGVERTKYLEYHSETSNNPGTSGGISVGNLNYSGNVIYLRINSQVESNANIVLAMAFNPSINFDEAVETTWNGQKLTTDIVVAVSGSAKYVWFDWKEYTIENIQLKKGVNELALRLVGDLSPNYDYIKLEVSPVKAENVTGIELTTAPAKTSYIEGELFDTTGMVISALYEDGTKVAINDYTLDKTKLAIGDTEIVATYKGEFTVSIPVTVTRPEVDSIEITQMPERTEYYVGQKFAPKGLVVTAHYQNGTTADVTEFVEFDHTVIMENDTKIVVSYDGKTADIAITLLQANHAVIADASSANYRVEAEDAVWIPNGGNKEKYSVVDDANASGGKRLDSCDWMQNASFMIMFTSEVETKAFFTVCCDGPALGFDTVTTMTWNGETITLGDIPATNWLVFDAHQTAEITVKKGLNVFVLTFNSTQMYNFDYFELNVNPLVGIEVSGEFATNYIEGEPFDTTGMTVSAKYLDGTKAVVTDYTIAPDGALTSENDVVTVSYLGKTAEVPITVTRVAVLENITVDSSLVQKEYYAGQAFNTKGLVVTAHFDDGTQREVTAYTIVESYIDVDTTNVTVEYEGKTAVIEGIIVKTHLTVEEQGSYRIEAEDAHFVSGNPEKDSYRVAEKDGVSGGKHLDGCDWLAGSTFMVSVDSKIATKAFLVVACDGPGFALQDVASLQWNGEDKSFAVSPTGGWLSFSAYTVCEVELRKGANLLLWTITNNQSVNYDYFELVVNPVVSIAVSGEYKTSYNAGDAFDITGMIVTATYLDGTTAVVNDYTVTPQILTADTDKVTVDYDGKTVDITVTVVRTEQLESITLDDSAVKKTYYAGQTFDPTGLVVTAHFDNGKKEVVTSYTIVNSIIGVDTTSIVVSYNGKTATINGIVATTHLTIDDEHTTVRIECEDTLWTKGSGDKEKYAVVDDAKASGGKRLDSCDWLDGSTFTVSLDVKKACKIKIIVATDGPGYSLQSVGTTTVNGNKIEFDVTPSGGWGAFAPYEIGEVELAEGANLFVWTLTGNINYDYFEFMVVEE